MNKFPDFSIGAHDILYLTDLTPQNEIWVNDELLAASPALHEFIKQTDQYLSGFYYIESVLFSAANIHTGAPILQTIRALCNVIAYSPDDKLQPVEVAKAFAGSLSSTTELSQHIGASPLRLAAFATWLLESGLSAHDHSSTIQLFRLFIEQELASISSAIFTSAKDFRPPPINIETLSSKRSLTSFSF